MARKLLLADDSITMQRLVSLTFADEDIEVISLGDGGAVTRRLKDVRPDIILVDVFLPGKNGYEICEMVKSDPQMRHVPVLLLVGTFEPLDPAEARRVKADDHLTKPFESTVLVSKVKDLLAKAPAPAAPEPASPAFAVAEAGKPAEPTAPAAAPVVSGEPPSAVASADTEAPRAVPPTEIPSPAAEPLAASPPTQSAASPPEVEEPPSPAPAVSELSQEAAAGATAAFGIPIEAAVGNSHPKMEDPLGDLLELDLDASALDEETSGFLVAPILDIYESTPDVFEAEPASVGVATTVKTDILETAELSAGPVAPEVAAPSHAPVAAMEPGPATSPAPVVSAPVSAEAIPEAWIEAVAQRVIQKLSDAVVREIAWEVVPELSELIIREQVRKTNPPKTS